MPSRHALVVLFDVFVLLGVVLFLCTLLPALLSRNVKRSIGWYSLMSAWLVYSLSYGLLLGRQEGPEPPSGLCILQTLLVYAVPALVATGVTCYYIEFYLIVSGLRLGIPRMHSPWRTFWLATIPWLVFLATILEVLLLIYPGKRVHLVQRATNNFYCNLADNIPSLVTAGLVIANMIILIPLEVWTGYMMFRNWDVFKRLTQTDRRVFLTVYLRLLLCTITAAMAFALSMLAFVFPEPDPTSLVYPTLSIFIAIAFGTQKDLLRAWLFWRSHQPFGSIVFENGGTITTNILTGTLSGVSSGSEIQSQLYKPEPSFLTSGVPLTTATEPTAETVPVVPSEAALCPVVRFELPLNPQCLSPKLEQADPSFSLLEFRQTSDTHPINDHQV